MSDYSINKDFLKKELDYLYNELNNIDELYSDSKNILDKHLGRNNEVGLARNPNYRFVSDQTSNLINLRDKKLSILKEIDNLKLRQEEFKYKEASFNKTDTTTENSQLISNILLAINNNPITQQNVSNDLNINDNQINDDIDLDDEIDKILDESDEKYIESNNKILENLNNLSNNDKKEYKLAFDITSNTPYIMDENYNIYPELSETYLNDYFKLDTFIKDLDNEIGLDEFHNEYELVEME